MLKQLGSIPGVIGGLVITSDGVVAAALEGTPSVDETAAYLSTVFLGLGSDAERLGLWPPRRLTLWAAKGRLVVIPYQDFALVVVADAVTDIGVALLDVLSLARRLFEHSKINV